MKKFILSFFVFVLSFSDFKSQTKVVDGLVEANNMLNQRIMRIISEADSLSQDIILVRGYSPNNYSRESNYCHVIQNQDSSTSNYILEIDSSLIISYTTVSVRGRPENNVSRRVNYFPEIKKLIIDDLFEESLQFYDLPLTSINFSNSDFTMIGIIDKRVFIKVFDLDFVKEFHSGKFYHLLTSYFRF